MKQKLLTRLDRALADIYHNATPDHPCNIPQTLWEAYDSRFAMWAELEIYYINDSLGASPAEYKKARKRGWPHKGERQDWLVSRINEYGKLYRWGRGGRTLAPEGLINQRGGSSFNIKSASEFEDYSNEALTEMIQVVEAFNAYVAQWNSRENLTYLWREECENELHELKESAKYTRKQLKQLAVEARALAASAGGAVCSTITREINRLRECHRELVQSIIAHNSVVKEV